MGVNHRLLAAAILLGLAGTAPAQPSGESPTVLRPAPRESFGTTRISYLVVDPSELNPYTSTNGYGGLGTLRYATSGAGFRLVAALHLPSGARVLTMELSFYDATTTGSAIASIAVCDNAPGVCGGVSASGGCPDNSANACSGETLALGYGSAIATLDGLTIDNVAHQYFVAAGTTSNDSSTALGPIRIGYILQVSPPPAGATFTDVPTSHPFFQFVEALAASGITGGCGGGNYCPDAPLTRGQMAVFLAKALGLQWE
jgi:hypothetical protein